MAFISSAGAPSLDTYYREAKTLATQIRASAVTLRNNIASNTSRPSVAQYCNDTRVFYDRLIVISQLNGIAAYANNEEAGNYVIGPEFTAMTDAMLAVVNNIRTTFPSDSGTGALLERTFDANGLLVDLDFSPAQLSTLGTLLDTLIATITAPA